MRDDVAQQDNCSDCAIHVVSNAAAALLGYVSSLEKVHQWRKIIPILIIATCYMDAQVSGHRGELPPVVSEQSVPQQGTDPDHDAHISHQRDAEDPVVAHQPVPHTTSVTSHGTESESNLPQFHEDHPVLVTLDETTPPGPPDPPLRPPNYTHLEENIPNHEAYRKPVDPSTVQAGRFHCGFLPTTVPRFYAGSFREDTCRVCGAYHWKLERTQEDMNKPLHTVAYSGCCKGGRMKRPPISQPFPPLIKQLLKRENMSSAQRTEVNECIRILNGRLSFASLCTTKPEIKLPGRGPYVFKVQGTFMRRISSAEPANGYSATYSQLYFVDELEAKRLLRAHPLAQQFTPYLHALMGDIHDLLRACNPYARSYKMMHDYCQSLVEQGLQVPELTLVFNHGKHLDERRYNGQTAEAVGEIAAILIGNPDKESHCRHLCVQLFDTGPYSMRYIAVTDPNADPLTYPLFFPFGDLGHVPGTPGWDPTYPPEVVPQNQTRRKAADAFLDDEAEEADINENDGEPEEDGPHRRKRSKKGDGTRPYSLNDLYSYNVHFRPEQRPANQEQINNVIPNQFSPLHYGGRLFQQYCVDSWSKVLEHKVNQLRKPHMQRQLRVDKYKDLQRYVQNRAERQNAKPGKVVVMPSTFLGGPKYMRQQYYNAMAICRNSGAPDLFITMTASSKWTEIQEALEPNQTTNDRPDLVCRVFKLKLDELLKDLFERNIFGEVSGYAWTIEYQKRGLPHVHILLILKNERDKPRMGAHVDRIISAEIPDKNTDPALYEAVVKHMIHGPCGSINPQCPCMQTEKCPGQCFRAFPFSHCEESNADVEGYPQYRRRKAAPCIDKLGKYEGIIDSSWVVPYNPYLLQKYDTHINVEISTSIKSFKYIYKYVYKGGDKAEINLRTLHEQDETDQAFLDLDELKNYIDSVYLSPCEAFWRIAGYPTNAVSHMVQNVALHLPDEQEVTFHEGEEEEVLRNAASDTMLTAFFKLNSGEGVDREDRDIARDSLYHDIPKHFTWDSSGKRWIPRKNRVPDNPSYNYNTRNKPVIGRINACSPKNLDKYALRLLLLNIKGPESFDDLLTDNTDPDNPIIYNSFQEAAIKKGLLQDEDEWHHCLDENAVDQMPSAMQQLFATILLNCDVPNPLELWERHKTQLVSHDPTLSMEQLVYIAYMAIDKHIQNDNPNNSLAQTYNIPVPTLSTPPSSPEEDTVQENDIDPAECSMRAEQMIPNLNAMQTHAFYTIVESVRDNLGKQIFIDGPGGTGKSYVYKTAINYLRGQHCKVCIVASTGIAATLIGGVTAHKRFGMPLDLDADTVSCISTQSKEAELLRSSNLIIWDEATASHKYAVDLLDRLLQDLMGNSLPFGGKTVVLGGDFRQCLPIVTRGTNSQQIAACIKMGKQWPLFSQNTIHLTENMRANDPTWAQWLLDVGNGLVQNPVHLDPTKLKLVHSPDHLVSSTFGNAINSDNIDSLKRTVILSSTNKAVLELNEKVLQCVQSPAECKHSIDTPMGNDNEDTYMIPTEFLHLLTPPGMPPHSLTMKVNGIYMLLRNMNVEAGQCNGSRFIVKQILPHSIHCELIQDDLSLPASTFILPRITSTPPKHYPFQFKRRQFPIRPAFAMTINKSQGGTFTKIGLDLTAPVFSHGQLYVALSRVPNYTAITILTPNTEQHTANVVYPAIFEKGYLQSQRRQRAPRPPHPSRNLTDEDHMHLRANDPPDEEDWSIHPPHWADPHDSFQPSTGDEHTSFIDPIIDPYSGLVVAPEDTLIFDD